MGVLILACLFVSFLVQLPSLSGARVPQKWNGGIVPYTISPRFTPTELKSILEVLAVFDQATDSCVRFKPLKSEPSYVMISLGTQCQSAIGRSTGLNVVQLARSCFTKRDIFRELMHALGFNDEHLRSDRDSAITVNRNNIRDSDWIFFQKLTDDVLPRFSQPYDLDSVLQRPANWKVDPGAPPGAKTLIPKTKGVQLGRSDTLTHLDINKIKGFYGC